MHIPEQLFSLPLLKDVRTQPIELIIRRTGPQVSAANLFTLLMYQVPKDRVFCVSSFAAACLPDPVGGTPVSVALTVDYDGLASTYVCAAPPSGFSLAAGQPIHGFGAPCSIWVPPGANVGLAVAFNTAATHSVTGGLSGICFPRGSVAVG